MKYCADCSLSQYALGGSKNGARHSFAGMKPTPRLRRNCSALFRDSARLRPASIAFLRSSSRRRISATDAPHCSAVRMSSGVTIGRTEAPELGAPLRSWNGNRNRRRVRRSYACEPKQQTCGRSNGDCCRPRVRESCRCRAEGHYAASRAVVNPDVLPTRRAPAVQGVELPTTR